MYYSGLVPIVAYILALTHLIWAVRCIRPILGRWTWGLLFSPAAYVFVVSLVLCVTTPLMWNAATKKVKERTGSSYGLLGFVVIVVMLMVVHEVVWGSVPLAYDANGAEHIRMIPFIPWPTEPFWVVD